MTISLKYIEIHWKSIVRWWNVEKYPNSCTILMQPNSSNLHTKMPTMYRTTLDQTVHWSVSSCSTDCWLSSSKSCRIDLFNGLITLFWFAWAILAITCCSSRLIIFTVSFRMVIYLDKLLLCLVGGGEGNKERSMINCLFYTIKTEFS